MDFSAIAVIPARGGSKGIPGKNLKLVNGKTLIERAILLAKKSELFDDIVVSTDSEAIATVASRFGATVHERDIDAATDSARSEDAIENALAYLKPTASHIGFLECTSPFIDPKDLIAAWDLLRAEDYDSLFSASISYDLHWIKTANGLAPLGHNPMKQTPRQMRAPTLVETGAFYFFSSSGFEQHKNRFFGKVGAYQVPRAHALEIDYPEDLIIANSLAQEIDPHIF